MCIRDRCKLVSVGCRGKAKQPEPGSNNGGTLFVHPTERACLIQMWTRLEKDYVFQSLGTNCEEWQPLGTAAYVAKCHNWKYFAIPRKPIYYILVLPFKWSGDYLVACSHVNTCGPFDPLGASNCYNLVNASKWQSNPFTGENPDCHGVFPIKYRNFQHSKLH